MAETIQASNLTKVYDLGEQQIRPVDDVSLEIYPGEMVAILGRSSSGKSTLLHILGCLLKPDSGQLKVEDLEVTRLEEAEVTWVRVNRVGFLYQAFNMLPDETAATNVEIPLWEQGIRSFDRRQRATEALEYLGLGNRLDRPLGELTAGQRQLVAVARAMDHDPAVILADEPTWGLDGLGREEVLGAFQKLNDKGYTIVIATSESAVARHCRRIIRIANGQASDEGLVPKRHIVPAARIPGPPTEIEVSQTEGVCPRCNYGNPETDDICQRCKFPLRLTEEEGKTLESRLSGADSRVIGVESPSDEGDVPGQELADELKELPFFAGLGPKSLVKIMPALEGTTYPKGTRIVTQGEQGDSFYIIRSGKVQVVLEGTGNSKIPVASLGPKEGFGEMSLLTDEPRSATVTAASQVEAWRLPKDAFDE